MNYGTLIQDSAGKIFANAEDVGLHAGMAQGEFPRELWQTITDAGFQLVLTEGDRGFGVPIEEALGVFQQQGYYRVPLPLPETAIGLALLAQVDVDLPEDPGLIVDSLGCAAVTAERNRSQWTISGTVEAVAWASHASWILLHPPGVGLVLVKLQQDEVHLSSPTINLAGIPASSITFEQASVTAVIEDAQLSENDPIRHLGALVSSAMMVGTMEWTFQQTLQYANDRVQFGRPIGKNQAIQHLLAQAAGEISSAKMAVRAAAHDRNPSDVLRSSSADMGTAIAKIICSEAANLVARTSHQIFAAIGFTQEHPLHIASKQLWSARQSYGSDAWWAGKLGQAVIKNGSENFWSSMVSRRFQENQQ